LIGHFFVGVLWQVHVLEKKLSEVYQSMNDAEEERLKKQQAVLSTVRSLVLDMGRNEGISLGSNSQDGCEYSVSTIFSEEKVAALEKFFAILRVLIKQESQKMDTFAFALQQVLLNDRFSGEKMTRDSKIKGANEEGKQKRKQQNPNSDFSLNFLFSASIFYPKSDFSFQHLDDELQKVQVQQ
jgi:hypothetical protein